MTEIGADLRATRLDLAGTREFTLPGAGPVRRSAIADATRAWLTELYAGAVGEYEGIALAAVGSLGRGWSGPLSDLDLVLVHDGRRSKGESLTEMADRLWYPIWDSGLALDHSVRSATECREVAREDLSAAVGLLDLSWVAGDEELVAGVRATTSHDWRSGARTRLPEFVESVRARHRRHGELSQQVEPDLKGALGGLRDVTVLDALTRAWLTDRPHGSVGPALEQLLDVRDALHVVTGRGRDRLLREEHDAVAALLGLGDADALLTSVSTSARTIAWALEATMRRAGQSQRARILRVGPRRPTMTPLGHGLFTHDGEAVLGSTGLVGEDPTLPLRAAVVAARAGLPLSPQTLVNLATCPDLPTPYGRPARELLTDLLATEGLASVWEGLDQVGVIERWMPEWAAVRGRPQRHPVHRHTVDRHLLETVNRARALGRDVARPDLLLLAALLHDIGKIAGARDHSRTGAGIAERVLERWGLPDEERATVVLLVREHLTLIDTATRRDLSDPATVDGVCRLVGEDPQTFELLRALTIADARAAGPTAWTDWRASLLDTLTGLVRERLTGVAPPVPPLAPEPTVDAASLDVVAAGRAHARVEPDAGGWSLTIHCRDREGLFADTAGLLAAHGMTVRRARLATVGEIAVDEWFVESPGGDPPEPGRLVADLARLEAGDRTVLRSIPRRRGRALPPTPAGGTSAFVLPSAGSGATVLEVRSPDRPGLLHDLGRGLAGEGVSVRSAHISTFAGQTLDTVYVTDREGQELDPAAVARAIAAVIDACDHA